MCASEALVPSEVLYQYGSCIHEITPLCNWSHPPPLPLLAMPPGTGSD
jgi:hypothetical protein